MLNIDTSKLPKPDRVILHCKVIDLGSGSAPKFVIVELPGVDGARQQAYWSGFPAIAVDDYVKVQRNGDSGRYDIVGADLGKVISGEVAPPYGKIHHLKTDGTVGVYTDFATAAAAASSGLLRLGPGDFDSDNVSVSAQVDVKGEGVDKTTLQNSTDIGNILSISIATISDLTIQNVSEVASRIKGITTTGTCVLDKIKFFTNNSGATSDTSTCADMVGGDVIDCEMTALSDGRSNDVCLDASSAVNVFGGNFDGTGGAPFDTDGGTINLFSLPRGVGTPNGVTGTGTIKGWYVDSNGKLTWIDSAANPPLNITARSAEPSSPAAGDIYLDTGANTASGDPGWRRYTGAAWEDIGATSGGGGWPYNTKTITVDASDADADYSDLASAITAASAGDIIIVGSDLAPSSEVDASKAITVIFIKGCKITCSGGDAGILVSAAATLVDVEAENTDATGGSHGIEVEATGATLIRCIGRQTGLGNANQHGISIAPSGAAALDVTLIDCEGYASGGGGGEHGLVNNSTGDVRVVGGYYTGDDNAIDDVGSAVTNLEGPTLEGTLNIGGTWTGNYYDKTNDKIVYAQGTEISVQGTSGGPQSGSARDIVERLGHILDGGHPANPYPATRDADDAEFNNSEQSENNSIGTHAGGDFWEWKTGTGYSTPGTVSINSTDSHLVIKKLAADTDLSALVADVTATANGDDVKYELFVSVVGNRQIVDNAWIGLRGIDTSTGEYARIRYDYQSDDTIDVIFSADIGSGESTVFTLAGLPPMTPAFTLGLFKYSTSQYARAHFAIPGAPGSEHIADTNYLALRNFGGSGQINIDEVWIEFGNAGGALIQYEVDSFRRIDGAVP